MFLKKKNNVDKQTNVDNSNVSKYLIHVSVEKVKLMCFEKN